MEASTAALERQCKLLEAQKKTLQEIQARNTSSQADSTRTERSSKCKREKAQAEFEASELAESLRSHISQSLKQSESATDGIHSTIERTLEKDDRLLDGLHKVLPQLSDASLGSGPLKEVENLCQSLIAYSSAEIHARIDTAFQSAVQTNGNQLNGTLSSPSKGQAESLRAELEELCREIDGLSTMAVDNQYRTPISKAIESAKSESDGDKARWMQYMSDTLHYLTARLEGLDDGTQQLRSQNAALKTISKTLDSVQAMTVERKQSTQPHAQSPSKALQRGLKPLRLVQANLSESQDPAAQLLRQLDVRVSDSRDSIQLAENLDAAVKDKSNKLVALSGRTESTVAEQVSRSIAISDANARALIEGVYAYSPYATINVVNQEVTDGIKQLEIRTQALSKEMRELEVDTIGKLIREKQRALLQ